MDKLLYGGTVVTASGSRKADIGITQGKISHLLAPGEPCGAAERIDVTGKYVLPGAIDEHVHFNDPGTTFREDFVHGTAACAAGGITTAIAMPTNSPLILNRAGLQATLDAYSGRGYVDYAVHGGLEDSNPDQIEDLWCNTGIASIKAFICYSSPDMSWVRDDKLFDVMQLLAAHDGTMIIHSENHELIKLYENRLKAAGRNDPLAHCQSHPIISEVEAVKRVLYYVEQTGLTVVFPHMSSAEGLREIKKARDAGLPVYAETCAQYLTFTEEDVAAQGPYLKFTPPVHGRENRAEMLELLKAGYVNTIASDHSPYTTEEKDRGLDCIWNSPNGIPGLEVLLPTMLNAVNNGLLTLEKVVEMTSATQAKIFHLPGKGAIEIGYDADLVVVDMDKEMAYAPEHIQSKNKWSPYLGRTYRGWPVMTFVRGALVAKDHQVVGEPGHGRYIERPKG